MNDPFIEAIIGWFLHLGNDQLVHIVSLDEAIREDPQGLCKEYVSTYKTPDEIHLSDMCPTCLALDNNTHTRIL
jgi:hypothetical protein